MAALLVYENVFYITLANKMMKSITICLAGTLLILGVFYLMVNLSFIDMDAKHLKFVPGAVAVWIALVFLYPHLRQLFKK